MITTLLLAACIGQFSADDFRFMQAQEDWVIDNLPPPKPLHWYLPRPVYAQVEILYDDCARCRTHAVSDIVKMGPDVIRWMLWVRRAKNRRVADDAEDVITLMARCPVCGGTGTCPGYAGGPSDGDRCTNCKAMRYVHQYELAPRACTACAGHGFFQAESR